MKFKLVLLFSIIILLVISSFFIFIVINGYSPYSEGIGVRIYTVDESFNFHSPHGVFVLFEKDDYEKVPKIKTMMDILLDQQFSPQRKGYNVMDSDLTSYWVNTSIDELSIQTGMSKTELNNYREWEYTKRTNLFEYKDRIFHLMDWIT